MLQLSLTVMVATRAEGAQGGRLGALPAALQEGRIFLLNFCLLTIDIGSLFYRDEMTDLTPKEIS